MKGKVLVLLLLSVFGMRCSAMDEAAVDAFRLDFTRKILTAYEDQLFFITHRVKTGGSECFKQSHVDLKDLFKSVHRSYDYFNSKELKDGLATLRTKIMHQGHILSLLMRVS